MKLEAVDKRNSMLIRVTTISAVEDHRIKVYIQIYLHLMSVIKNQHENYYYQLISHLLIAIHFSSISYANTVSILYIIANSLCVYI